MNSTLYCDRFDVEDVLSDTGVELRIDDGPPRTLGNCLDEAASVIEQKCLLRYDVPALSGSRVVKHWAKWIATFLLCKRRGNGPSEALGEEYDRVMKELDAVAAGKARIGDAVERRPSLPGMSNVRVIKEPWPHVVVERRSSTGLPPQEYRQKVDPIDWTNSVTDYAI